VGEGIVGEGVVNDVEVYDPEVFDGQSIDTYIEDTNGGLPSYCQPADGNMDPIFTNKVLLEHLKYQAWGRRFPNGTPKYITDSKIEHLTVEDIPYVNSFDFQYDKDTIPCKDGQVAIPCEGDIAQYNCTPCPLPQLGDVNGIECLPFLEVAGFAYEPVTNIDGICTSKGIKNLYILDTQILSSYKFLECLPSLEDINLTNCNVKNEDLKPLQYANYLFQVTLSGVNITDLTPLVLNDNFKGGNAEGCNLYIYGLTVPCEQIRALQAKGVRVEADWTNECPKDSK
jgi:hypothetical protein